MRRIGTCALVLSVALVFGATEVFADVKTDEKSQVKFGGMLGKVMGMFGGKAMKEGLVSKVAVKGDRKMTITDNTAQLIDLTEEKIYDIDLKKQTYKVTTFAELRQKLQEAREKAEKEAQKSRDKKDAKELEIDFKASETGQKKTINGFDCSEVLMTITVREKGKTLEEAGGMVLKSNNWMTGGAPALKESMDFEKRYTQKLAGMGPGTSAEAMAQAMVMYPGLQAAIGKMQTENVNLNGAPIQATMTVENVPSKELAEQQKKQEQESESSGGGLLGGFAKRLGKKKSDDQSTGAENKNVVMTMHHEILSVSTAVTPDDVSIPAGFKQKN